MLGGGGIPPHSTPMATYEDRDPLTCVAVLFICLDVEAHTQPLESPYTRRKIVIFKSAKLQICANFGAIGAIAQKKMRKSAACVDVCGGFAQKKKIR